MARYGPRAQRSTSFPGADDKQRSDAARAGAGRVRRGHRSASALIALTGAGYQEAVQTLRAVAERATRRRRERGVA